MILVLIDHDRGRLDESSLEAVTAASAIDTDTRAVVIGAGGDGIETGTAHTYVVHHPGLTDYGPDAWASAVSQLMDRFGADAVMATGTDRGNEVLAHVAARRGLPFVANALEIAPGSQWRIKRVRWGGSLHEMTALDAASKIVSVAAHCFEPAVAGDGPSVTVDVEISDDDLVTMVRDRVTTTGGITLATAPVVVAGGRGVGSADGFDQLQELAGLLGGVVGCSRVVTNSGWRNHKDQVGQTGTVVAPDLYVACGISGAIQHWVGMMASKNILAINTDKDSPMVTKSDYAVVGDLHQVVPAITAEILRRRAAG